MTARLTGGLSRFGLDAALIDYEPGLDGDVGAAPAADAAPDATPDTSAAPAADVAPPADEFTLSRDDWEALQDELAALRTMPTATAQPAPTSGGDIDLNEFLNPMNENFGMNLASLMVQMTQQQQQAFQPLLADWQQQQEARQTEAIAAPILDADTTAYADDVQREKAHTLARRLADLYLPDMEARYGQGSARARQAALTQSLQDVRGIASAAQQAGTQQAIDDLHAVGAAAAQPGPGGTALQMPAKAKTPEELLARTFGLPSPQN